MLIRLWYSHFMHQLLSECFWKLEEGARKNLVLRELTQSSWGEKESPRKHPENICVITFRKKIQVMNGVGEKPQRYRKPLI